MKYKIQNMWETTGSLNERTEEILNKMIWRSPPSDSSLNKGKDSDSIYQINNFMSNFPSLSDLSKLWQNWNSFLKTLTLEELGAVAHFVSSLFVLICLINIIMVIYGDFMIRYLKLETRLPKIAKIIQLRRQFQLYYMLIYFIPAILTLLAVMAINAYVLFG